MLIHSYVEIQALNSAPHIRIPLTFTMFMKQFWPYVFDFLIVLCRSNFCFRPLLLMMLCSLAVLDCLHLTWLAKLISNYGGSLQLCFTTQTEIWTNRMWACCGICLRFNAGAK